jgi:glycosyltransferase involved in cell wall biosynthesis
MSSLLLPRAGRTPVLFVAREPDETLRTFLPAIDRLRAAHGVESRVLFHHRPGSWAREELARRGLGARVVCLPKHGLPFRLLRSPLEQTSLVRTADEIGRFRRARALARAILDTERPAAVVVIQDTLLLERFLVRLANRRGLPTFVVQWAFNYPQAMYDRLRIVGKPSSEPTAQHGLRRRLGVATRAAYRAVLGALDLRFELANSYGGGEARVFAVMGDAFAEQFRAQGVRHKRIVVTGHPSHDAAYVRARTMDEPTREAIRHRYGLPTEVPLVLYATQPVLWRRVMTPDTLRANVRAIATAVAALPDEARLVLKLHPREHVEDYAFCAEIDPPVQVIPTAEMADLVACCDLFVSSSSSTVLLAMMLDRPIVTVNFNAVPHFDFFESIGGSLHTRTPDAFACAIRAALRDGPTRERLAGERRAVLAHYTRFDGRVAERLAGLIAEGIGHRECPAYRLPG